MSEYKLCLMRFNTFIFLSLLLMTSGCHWRSQVPEASASARLGDSVSEKRTELLDQVAGNLTAARLSNQASVPSRFREVTEVFLSDALRITGSPTVQTQTKFEQTAAKLLSPDAVARAAGESERLKLVTDNAALKQEVGRLEEAHRAALAQERANHAAEIERVQLEAQARERRTITWIFFGGGALLLAAAAGLLAFASSIPFAGPKAAMGVGAAGITLIGTGVVINQLAKHPWVLWTGLGLAAVALAVAFGLMISNQFHGDSKSQ